MKIIRPITLEDYEDFQKLAYTASIGIISLPKDPVLLLEKITDSLKAFSEHLQDPHHILYIFILEDLDSKKVEGTCAIKAKTGGSDPLYYYHIENVKKTSIGPYFSRDLQILKPIIYPEGPTEIGGLYLLPDHRKEGFGKLLSLSRFLFIASHPQRFDQRIFADMRGVFDSQHCNYFWENVGRQFFDVSLEAALELIIHSKKFIPEILPQYPIYISLLPKEVQEVIGKTHSHTAAALKMLQNEGFSFTYDVNIFDGGPVIAAPVDHIRTIRESTVGIVDKIVNQPIESEEYMMCTLNQDFRCCLGSIMYQENSGITINADVADALKLNSGDRIRYVRNRPVLQGEQNEGTKSYVRL